MVNSTVSEADVTVAVIICYTIKGKDRGRGKNGNAVSFKFSSHKVTFSGIFSGADPV